jgi:hypothetical protein
MRIDKVSFDSDRIARYNSISRISASELACAMDQMLKDLVSLDRGIFVRHSFWSVSRYTKSRQRYLLAARGS